MTDKKPILAIETSDVICSAAIFFSDEKYFASATRLKNAHSEKIFEIIDYLLDTCNIEISDLDSIAISEGPGSFTGLRIGMSAAKGLAHGASLPLIAVPTFEALAYQISQILPDGYEFALANKVNREEVYFAKFQIRGNNYIFVDKLSVIKNKEFIKLSDSLKVFGSAVSLIDKSSEQEWVLVAPAPEFVAKWASKFGQKTYDYDFIEPNYLKNFIAKEKK